jgi:hypothetical protein
VAWATTKIGEPKLAHAVRFASIPDSIFSEVRLLVALRISIQRHAAVVTARTAVAASWRVEGICSKLRASRSASLEAKTRKEPFCLSRLTNVTCIQHIYRYPDLSIFWGASIHVPRSKNPCAEFHYPCHPYGEVGNSTVRYSL